MALFGAIGLGMLSIFSPHRSTFDDPRYQLLERIMPIGGWQVTFILAGTAQLVGLFKHRRWLRLSGAVVVFFCLVCVVQSIVLAAAWQLSLSVYMACIFTEFCAIIFQTATIIRLREFPTWWNKWMFRL